MKPAPPSTQLQKVTVRCGVCGNTYDPAAVRRVFSMWLCTTCPLPERRQYSIHKRLPARQRLTSTQRKAQAPIEVKPELCPTPRKTPYNTRRKADQALRTILKVPGRAWYPLRSYRCACGKFHHTTQSS